MLGYVMFAALLSGIGFLICFLVAMFRESKTIHKPAENRRRRVITFPDRRNDAQIFLPVFTSVRQHEHQTVLRPANLVVLGRREGVPKRRRSGS